MKKRYINPFTDFGFKRLFGSEPNKDLLIDLLNELIKERGRIQNLTYLKAEQLGLSEAERRAVFDLYCESETGEKFIVEMQKATCRTPAPGGHPLTSTAEGGCPTYSTFPIREQAQRGQEWDFQLNAVYNHRHSRFRLRGGQGQPRLLPSPRAIDGDQAQDGLF